MSSEQAITHLIPGPLYPDMFDGETPIMVPPECPLKLFQVEVCFVIHEEARSCLLVAAPDEDEAQRLALKLAERKAEENEGGHEVFDAEEVDESPSPEQVLQWHEFSEARHV